MHCELINLQQKALELVLQEYLSEEKAIQNLPVLRMITESKADVEKRARSLKRILQNAHLLCNDRDGTV